MPSLAALKIKIFADGANLEEIATLAANPLVQGFTTNPTLMRKANVRDYRSFAHEMLSIVGARPVSFEVFSDDFLDMERQAFELASWGTNVFVKIPVTNTKGEYSDHLVRRLSTAGVQVNVTAMMTVKQVERIADCLSDQTNSIVSVFAGRIADTGRDPVPVMEQAVGALRSHPRAELIWASPRELLNIFQADLVGCHIITATGDVLAKLHLVGKDLDAYSLETATIFHKDAVAAGYVIEISGKIPQPIISTESATR